MPVVHKTQRMQAMSLVPQANYLTPTDTADEEDFVRIEVTDSDFTDLTPATADNEEDAHGFENATEQYLESWDAEAPHGLAVSSEQIGRFLLDAFGGVVTDQPAAVASPTVYRHVFTPMDITTTRQLPARTFIEVMGTALNRQYPSMCLETLNLSGDGLKRIDSSFKYRGSGKEIIPSGLSVAQMKLRLLEGLHYFFNSQATIRLSDSITLANAVNYGSTRRHNTWSFGWNNQFLNEDGFFPGGDQFQITGDKTSGATRTELLVGKRIPDMNVDVRFLSQSEEHAALKSQKKIDGTIELTGGIIEDAFNHKLTIQAHQMQYKMVKLAERNGLITSRITPKIEVVPDSGAWITATLINNVPSYTV